MLFSRLWPNTNTQAEFQDQHGQEKNVYRRLLMIQVSIRQPPNARREMT